MELINSNVLFFLCNSIFASMGVWPPSERNASLIRITRQASRRFRLEVIVFVKDCGILSDWFAERKWLVTERPVGAYDAGMFAIIAMPYNVYIEDWDESWQVWVWGLYFILWV